MNSRLLSQIRKYTYLIKEYHSACDIEDLKILTNLKGTHFYKQY